MSAPDPETFSWATRLLAPLGVVTAPVIWIHKRLDRKADKIDVAEKFQEVSEELQTQRGHIAKLFDQLRENEQRAQDRHEKVMEAVYRQK